MIIVLVQLRSRKINVDPLDDKTIFNISCMFVIIGTEIFSSLEKIPATQIRIPNILISRKRKFNGS